MINERLAPKMNLIFSFENSKNQNAIDSIIKLLEQISQNERLVKNNCPLNRLNIELSNSDKDFDNSINKIFDNIILKIDNLLKNAIKNNEIKQIDTYSLSEFIVTSIWGALSLSINQSSVNRFIQNTNHLKQYLLSLK